MAKEDASLLIVSIEELVTMLSCMIDALEKHYVAMVDIPGTFMQANMDELLHMQD